MITFNLNVRKKPILRRVTITYFDKCRLRGEKEQGDLKIKLTGDLQSGGPIDYFTFFPWFSFNTNKTVGRAIPELIYMCLHGEERFLPFAAELKVSV